MIDLTKPIRRKRDGMRAKRVSEAHFYTIEHEDGRVAHIDMEILERDFENIPEPRKPREWWFNLYSDGFFGLQNNSIEEAKANVLKGQSAEHIRVIEWPGGAPLPDWPEDGG